MKKLNEKQLREVCKCSSCKKGVMHKGDPTFWTIKVNRYGIKHGAIQRQTGLEMMMGNNAMLAQVMGPNEDMAEQMMKEETLTFCEECMLLNNIILMSFVEK